MEMILKINTFKNILVSRDNIITEVDRKFLELIGYTQRELVGSTLMEVGKMLRIDSQVNLQDIEDDTTVFLFTKELIAIEGIISCEIIDNGSQSLFSFKRHCNNSINEKFNLVNKFGTSRGDGTALFSFSNELLINSNQNYLVLLQAPYNKKTNSIGKSIIEIVPGYSSTQFNNIKDHIKYTGMPYYIKEMNIDSGTSGQQYWSITLVPILEEGIIKYLLLSLSNVTEEVLNRKAIKQRNEELEAAIKNMSDEVKVRNKVEETLDMQNQMFSTISHELKTPLSVIFSASQLIEMYLKEEKNKINIENIGKSINTIKQNCYRFTKLVNNIVDLFSIESGFYKLNFRNGNIVEIVEDIVDSVRVYVENKGLKLVFDTEIEEKVIAIDVDKMERIILNLISNAAKFSHKGGKIYVDIKDKGDFVEILVRDYGVGINQKYLNTIFDKYHKVDNFLAKNTEGSGIGLALVKTMVELLGGEISVESELGTGSLFTVRLPVEVLDKSKVKKTTEHTDNRIEQINIEFSDVYPK